MNEYVTLDDMKRYRGRNQTDRDNDLLAMFAHAASRMVDQFTGRKFYVRRETRYFDHPDNTLWDNGRFGWGYLQVDDDLLEVVALTTDNGDRQLAPAEFFLACGTNSNLRPYNRIVLNANSSSAYFDFTETPQRSNQVDGIWGYHDEYDKCWVDTGLTLTEEMTAQVAVLPVGDVSNTKDVRGFAPAIKTLHTLKIDDEFLYVYEVGQDGVPLVERAVNGTTAAIHLVGAKVYSFRSMGIIEQVTRRITNWLYMQKDSAGDMDRPIVTQAGVTLMPSRMPQDISSILGAFRSPFGRSGV
ncbi:MAG: hypothetical protein FOGNACKC_00915 [Anaerolineae bacterium]|nr:hypothetical protein [Anaerolineae bacterium]